VAVEIGLRILALIIDCIVCFFSLPAVFYASGWIIKNSGNFALLIIPLWFASLAAWPFLYFGVPTGLWGRTLGKFVCRLEVTFTAGERPGLWRGIGRETLKLISIFSLFGIFFCAFQVFYQGTTWYDTICETQVEFKPRVRLTKTQKRFRQYMKEQKR